MDHLGGSLSIHFVYSNNTQLTLDFQVETIYGPGTVPGGRLAIRINGFQMFGFRGLWSQNAMP